MADLGPANVENFADEAGQVGQWTAELATVCVYESVELLIRRAIVDKDGDSPRSGDENVARDLHDVHEVQPRDIDSMGR